MVGVALDPFQNIIEVGWPGNFAWLSFAFESSVQGFAVYLDQPSIADYNRESGETTDPAFGWPTAPADFDHWQMKFVFFDDSSNPLFGGGVFFVNVARLYSQNRQDFQEQGFPPLRTILGSGFAFATDGGQIKVRSQIYKGKSRALIPSFSPTGGFATAATLDQLLDSLDLVGGELATKRVVGGVEPYIASRLYAVPPLGGGFVFTFGHWTWDYPNRANAVLYPPSGAEPTFS